MTEELARYRQLQRRLWTTRWRHEGEESVEEDDLLDAMDESWLRLGEEERILLRNGGPRCWPMDLDSKPPDLDAASPHFQPNLWSYEGFRSASDAILSEEAA